MSPRRQFLSGAEYDRRVVQLHEQLPEKATARQRESVKRAELELMIDHKLGLDFPAARREALWDVQQRIDRKRFRLLAAGIIDKLLPGFLTCRSHHMAQTAIDLYATVLDDDELKRFFGAAEMNDWREPG